MYVISIHSCTVSNGKELLEHMSPAMHHHQHNKLHIRIKKKEKNVGNLQSSDWALKVSVVASKLVDVLMPIGSSSMIIAHFSLPDSLLRSTLVLLHSKICFYSHTTRLPGEKKRCREQMTSHYVLFHGISHIHFTQVSEPT